MTALVALPIAIPAAAAAACFVARRSLRLQRAFAAIAAAAVLGVGVAIAIEVWRRGPLELVAGGWPAGVGVRLRADLLAAVMIAAVGAVATAAAAFAIEELPAVDVAAGAPPLMLLLVMGACGALLTADLFNLYVWLEVLLIASFVLLALGRGAARLRGTAVYAILGVIASALLLTGIAATYGAVHALDFDVVRARLAELAGREPGLVLALAAPLLVGLGVKAAVVPLGAWLPIAYPTAAPSIAALFACLAAIGVAAMARIAVAVLPLDPAIAAVLAPAAAATMVAGAAAAAVQTRLRALISFLDVGHLGYPIAAIAVGAGAGAGAAARRTALAAALYYLLHHLVVTASLFLIAGAIRRARGHEELAGLGGLARREPVLAAALAIAGLGMAGVPPLSGFWAKLAVVDACLGAGRWLLAAAAIAGGALTLFALLRLWRAAAGDPPAGATREPEGRRLLVHGPIVALALVTVLLGAVPGPALALAAAAAAQLAGGPP